MRHRSASLSALLAAALSALLLPATPAQASPPRPDRPGTQAAPPRDERTDASTGGSGAGAAGPIDLIGLDFQLINAGSRWCLTSGLTELPCATTDPYRWRFRPADMTGTMELLNVRTDTCLSLPGGAAEDGTRAALAPCTPALSRRWTLRDSLGETAKLVNNATGTCLAVESGVAVQGPCTGDDGSRRWTVRLLNLLIPGLGTVG